jgi:hypothetical protein
VGPQKLFKFMVKAVKIGLFFDVEFLQKFVIQFVIVRNQVSIVFVIFDCSKISLICLGVESFMGQNGFWKRGVCKSFKS